MSKVRDKRYQIPEGELKRFANYLVDHEYTPVFIYIIYYI